MNLIDLDVYKRQGVISSVSFGPSEPNSDAPAWAGLSSIRHTAAMSIFFMAFPFWLCVVESRGRGGTLFPKEGSLGFASPLPRAPTPVFLQDVRVSPFPFLGNAGSRRT